MMESAHTGLSFLGQILSELRYALAYVPVLCYFNMDLWY